MDARRPLLLAVAGLLAPALVTSCQSAPPTVAGSGDSVVTAKTRDTRLVVRLDEHASVRNEVAAARRLGADTVTHLDGLDAYAVEVPTHRRAHVADDLESREDVDSVVVAHPRYTFDVPDDPQWARQATALEAVRAPQAWDVTGGSADVTIAVVDTGVDVTLPDLAGKIAGTYNAVNHHETVGPEHSQVSDSLGHGTSVASVAAATRGNGVGIAGTGGDARILAVKVANARGEIWSDAVADGVRWAADHGADVINISLGSPERDRIESEAVAYARRAGAVVVAAAGNEGNRDRQYPAANPGVLAVGGTQANGRGRVWFSSYGLWVDVAAPAIGIRAAKAGGGYAWVGGTSFSAPLVAGQVALVAAAHPTWGPGRLAAAVRTTTRGSTLVFAHGLVNFRASLSGPREDLTPPRLTVATAGAHTAYPYRHGKAARTRLTVHSSEALRSLELQVLRPGGARLWSRSHTHVLAGDRTVSWSGRRDSGRPVPVGRYRFRFVAVDRAGNRAVSAASILRVSARHR